MFRFAYAFNVEHRYATQTSISQGALGTRKFINSKGRCRFWPQSANRSDEHPPLGTLLRHTRSFRPAIR